MNIHKSIVCAILADVIKPLKSIPSIVYIHTCNIGVLSQVVRSRRSEWQCRRWPPHTWRRTSAPPYCRSPLSPGHAAPGGSVGRREQGGGGREGGRERERGEGGMIKRA